VVRRNRLWGKYISQLPQSFLCNATFDYFMLCEHLAKLKTRHVPGRPAASRNKPSTSMASSGIFMLCNRYFNSLFRRCGAEEALLEEDGCHICGKHVRPRLCVSAPTLICMTCWFASQQHSSIWYAFPTVAIIAQA
jgi:hypothetical protein